MTSVTYDPSLCNITYWPFSAWSTCDRLSACHALFNVFVSSLKYVLIHVFWFCDWRSDNNTRDHKFKLILHYAIPHFKFSLKFAKLLILIYRYDVAVSHCRGMKEIFAANTTSWSLKSLLKENDLDILKMVYFRSWLWIVHYNVLG